VTHSPPPSDKIELLQSFYEAFQRGDLDTALDHCDPKVEVYLAADVVAAIRPRGRENVAKYLQSWFETWDEYNPEPEQFIEAADGEHVVAFIRLEARGKGSRFQMEERVADVFTVREGKIKRLRLYVHRDKALESVGLPTSA
jgi:ketosteroid isomerase-like protein